MFESTMRAPTRNGNESPGAAPSRTPSAGPRLRPSPPLPVSPSVSQTGLGVTLMPLHKGSRLMRLHRGHPVYEQATTFATRNTTSVRTPAVNVSHRTGTL